MIPQVPPRLSQTSRFSSSEEYALSRVPSKVGRVSYIIGVKQRKEGIAYIQK
jgi:hypothetical protein